MKVSEKLNNIAKEASMLLNEDKQNASVADEDQIDTSDAYIQLKVIFFCCCYSFQNNIENYVLNGYNTYK